jgi:hypothetical protein
MQSLLGFFPRLISPQSAGNSQLPPGTQVSNAQVAATSTPPPAGTTSAPDSSMLGLHTFCFCFAYRAPPGNTMLIIIIVVVVAVVIAAVVIGVLVWYFAFHKPQKAKNDYSLTLYSTDLEYS